MEKRHAARAFFPERAMKAHGDADHGTVRQLLQRSALLRKAQRSRLQHAQRQRDDDARRLRAEALAEESAAHRCGMALPFHFVYQGAELQPRAVGNDRIRQPAEQRPIAALRPRLGCAEGAGAPLLDDRSRAHAARIGGIEAFHHHPRKGPGLRGQPPPREELLERDIAIQCRVAHRTLCLGEGVHRTQAAFDGLALLAHRIHGREPRLLQKRMGDPGFAVVSLLLSILFTSPLMRSPTGRGRFFGPIRPCHSATSKPGTPDSATAGTSGSAGRRFAVVTAMARRRPDFTCGSAVAVLLKRMSVWPEMVSVSAGLVPLYGT